MAFVVATGGAILDDPTDRTARATGTTVVDLVLPDSATMPDSLPGHSKGSGAGAAGIVPHELDSDRPTGSHMRLAAVSRDVGVTSSPRPVAGAPESPPGIVTDADVGTVSGTTAASSAVADVAAPADVGEPPPVAPAPVAPAHRVTIRSGDSLYLVFKRLGLPQRDLALMTEVKPLAKKLARLAPRQEIEFYVDTESGLTRLVHRLDRLRSLHVFRDGDAFAFEEIVEPPDVVVGTATGVIETSLFEAGQHAGLSDSLIMQMAEIFGWDVDFVIDIRVGDRFAVVFEEQFKDGERIGEGPIVAAEFTNRGRRIRAVRYVDPAGRADYFSPDGRSMRKAFLRTPVNFTRISSRFSLSRRHPILHKMRAHRGVDYAAPRGTAVKASGDGRVVFAGRNGGYGRTIILRHGSVYTTLYAHLSRFSRGIRPGKRVEQGQTIGYVGSTGLATGPHLHYEFRVRGAHRDPLRVKFPPAAPLAEEYMDDFRRKAKPLLAKLDLTTRTAIATAD